MKGYIRLFVFAVFAACMVAIDSTLTGLPLFAIAIADMDKLRKGLKVPSDVKKGILEIAKLGEERANSLSKYAHKILEYFEGDFREACIANGLLDSDSTREPSTVWLAHAIDPTVPLDKRDPYIDEKGEARNGYRQHSVYHACLNALDKAKEDRRLRVQTEEHEKKVAAKAAQLMAANAELTEEQAHAEATKALSSEKPKKLTTQQALEQLCSAFVAWIEDFTKTSSADLRTLVYEMYKGGGKKISEGMQTRIFEGRDRVKGLKWFKNAVSEIGLEPQTTSPTDQKRKEAHDMEDRKAAGPTQKKGAKKGVKRTEAHV